MRDQTKHLVERKLYGKKNIRGKCRADLEISGQLYLAELHGTWIEVVEVRPEG